MDFNISCFTALEAWDTTLFHPPQSEKYPYGPNIPNQSLQGDIYDPGPRSRSPPPNGMVPYSLT